MTIKEYFRLFNITKICIKEGLALVGGILSVFHIMSYFGRDLPPEYIMSAPFMLIGLFFAVTFDKYNSMKENNEF